MQGRPIYESHICALFVDERHRGSGDAPPLIPDDPFEATLVRSAVELVGAFTGTLYGALRNRDPSKAEELKELLLGGIGKLETFYAENKLAGGPYLLGERMSHAEIAFAPLFCRFVAALTRFRGFSPLQDAPTVASAFEAAAARPAFRQVG